MLHHQLSLITNATTVSISPYAKYMYTHECPRQMRMLNRSEKVKFLNDQQLYIDYGTHVQIYNRGFCLENFFIPGSNEVYMSAFLCKTENLSMYLLHSQTSNSSEVSTCMFNIDFEVLNRWLRFAYTICGFFSLAFIVLTLFFYLTLPELRNFQGNIVCSYIFSMALTTIFLIANYNVKVISESLDEPESEFLFTISVSACKLLGYLLYCSGLLMCLWMSVLCYDLMRWVMFPLRINF